MATKETKPSEKSRAKFMELRQRAIDNLLFQFAAHDAPREFIREWRGAGWIAPSNAKTGRFPHGSWELVEKYRAYGPDEPRFLTPEDCESYLAAARESLNEDGSIQVTVFKEKASREGLLRLIEAGFVTCDKSGARVRAYMLDKEHREA